MTTTTAGTTCPTVAEDRVANAIVASDAWHDISESNTETRESQHVFFDELPLPDDGYAFTLDELAELHAAALVFTDPEEGFAIEQGDAQDYSRKSGRVLIIVERWVRESEALDNSNQQRTLKDALGNMMEEIHASLTGSFGPRWMQKIIMKQPPVSWDEKHKEISGRRQQAAIAVEWGGAAGSSD
jgi:hypothetical protein